MRGLLLAVVLVAGSASAAPRLGIAPVTGDKGHAVQKQLSASLCKRLACAPGTPPMRGSKPDLKRAKRSGIDAVLTGRIGAGQLEVTVTLVSHPKPPALHQTYALSHGKLSKAQLGALADVVAGLFVTSEPTATPESPPESTSPPPVAEGTEPPPTEKHVGHPPAERKPVEESPEEERRPSRREEVAEPGKPVTAAPILLVDVGLDLVGRNVSYDTVAAGNPLQYQASAIFSPRLMAEVYPLARTLQGVPQRVGLTLDGAFALGLQSQLAGTRYPTSLSRFDVGLLVWFGSLTGASFAPEVGFRLLSFSTGQAKDGTSLGGLPNVTYSALRFSGALRWAVNDLVKVEARLSAMPVLGTGQLIGGPFFSKGSGFAFEGEGGVRFSVTPHVGIAVFGEYTRYGFGFSSQPTDAYQAKGAADAYYGGRAAATFTL